MTYPLWAAGRTVTLTGPERGLLLRLLDFEWSDLDSRTPKTSAVLLYMRDIETLQAKLK